MVTCEMASCGGRLAEPPFLPVQLIGVSILSAERENRVLCVVGRRILRDFQAGVQAATPPRVTAAVLAACSAGILHQ